MESNRARMKPTCRFLETNLTPVSPNPKHVLHLRVLTLPPLASFLGSWHWCWYACGFVHGVGMKEQSHTVRRKWKDTYCWRNPNHAMHL